MTVEQELHHLPHMKKATSMFLISRRLASALIALASVVLAISLGCGRSAAPTKSEGSADAGVTETGSPSTKPPQVESTQVHEHGDDFALATKYILSNSVNYSVFVDVMALAFRKSFTSEKDQLTGVLKSTATTFENSRKDLREYLSRNQHDPAARGLLERLDKLQQAAAEKGEAVLEWSQTGPPWSPVSPEYARVRRSSEAMNEAMAEALLASGNFSKTINTARSPDSGQ